MKKISGLILDVYDDYNGDILRSVFASPEHIPDLVKSASALSAEHRGALPDDVFALVLLDGDTKLRKYACHDAGNTALSVLYFLKTAHKLPEEAKVRAAENLKVACSWYDLDVPEELKTASVLNKAMFALSVPGAVGNTKQSIKSNMAGIRANEAAGNSVVTPNQMRGKHAEVSGTSDAPISVAPSSKRSFPVRKTAHMYPVVDVTGKEPVSPVTCKTATLFALGDRYPLDSYEQVKAASAYLDEYWKRLQPDERREYSVKLAKRAEELDIPLGKMAAAYAGQEYADEDMLKVAFSCRASVLPNNSQVALLEALFEKRAQLDPELFTEALTQFDKETGLDRLYDQNVLDPFRSVYAEKIAADDSWKETIGNDHITGPVLKRFAAGQRSVVEKMFGGDFADEFCKDPIGIFKSLPREQKKVISRLANDDTTTNIPY